MANKVGHPRNVKTPEKMWELFQAYAAEVKANPRFKMVFVGKDGAERREELERPLTIEGFKGYCYDRVGVVEQYFKNQDNDYTEYLHICSRIREAIRLDQIEGGMVGQYNHSITQRLNNLTDKVEQTNITQPLFPDVPEDNSNK